MIDTTDTTGTTGTTDTTGTNEPKTYFIMTNEKGDYGCMTFTDYDMYVSCRETYNKLGWID
jgi:hypothetical protein